MNRQINTYTNYVFGKIQCYKDVATPNNIKVKYKSNLTHLILGLVVSNVIKSSHHEAAIKDLISKMCSSMKLAK